MWRLVLVAIACAVAVGANATPALGHADMDLGQTRPTDGSTLNRPPGHVRLHFTEPPTKQANVTVENECGADVVKTASVVGKEVHVFLKRPGERGTYEVSFAVISAVDGHPTRGKMSFDVSGEADCSGPTPSDDDADDGETGSAAPPPTDDSSFPIVPVALGSVALVGIAFVARRLTAD